MTGGVMFGVKHDLELLRSVKMTDVFEGEEGERQMRAMWFVWQNLTNSKINSDSEIVGFSVRHTPRGWRLTVKAEFGDTQQVAFVTDSTPMRCVQTFARWILEDRVKWQKDKYP